MSSRRITITTAIPYVNGPPHLGHALELVQADVLARHHRARGDFVRFATGTDENALKNVDAAAAAGVPVAQLVESNATRFRSLADGLDVSYDDFIRTSVDPRHRPGVERLWQACARRGDLYRRAYEGLYCAGCEAFVDGQCDEHPGAVEQVAEQNWFFRLSRYRDALLALVESGRLRIEPARRRNEVLALLQGTLDDFSVSRPAERAHGWGIPVPGDPTQVVYVWFDALANYITALGYGTDSDEYRTWWAGADERLHVIGKGILRFHAVYWPAILLSAGEPLPTTLWVHDYVTSAGAKVSKSSGGGDDPLALIARYGVDTVRWTLLRDGPHSRDADIAPATLAGRANELAGRIGNLVSRTLALQPATPTHIDLRPALDAALAQFDFRTAASTLAGAAEEANRLASHARPWEREDPEALATLLGTCEALGRELQPLLPAAATRIRSALAARDRAAARTLFRKAA
jgi:methionyl-tRNA synthetase